MGSTLVPSETNASVAFVGEIARDVRLKVALEEYDPHGRIGEHYPELLQPLDVQERGARKHVVVLELGSRHRQPAPVRCVLGLIPGRAGVPGFRGAGGMVWRSGLRLGLELLRTPAD